MSNVSDLKAISLRRALFGRSCAFLRLASVLAMVGFFLPSFAPAQTASTFDTGTITETIADPSGATIPHASVTITNTGTGSVTTAETNSEGIFSAPGLPFGDYVVTVSASQFAKTTTKPFALNVGATVRVDLKL